MHTTLSSPWRLPVLLLAASLLAGCGVTTKKTFLGEPVQENAGNAVPVSSGPAAQTSNETLSRNPALNSAEATGVQKLLNIITPYRVNVQQGNFISQEMLSRIQPGMTPEQVRFALGTPLLTDIFHAGRWDYVFRLQKPNGQVTHNRVIIYFEDNRVARIASDPLPDETQYLETIAGPVPQKAAGKKQAASPAGETEAKAAPEETATALPVENPSAELKETEETPAEAPREAEAAPPHPYEAAPAEQEPAAAPEIERQPAPRWSSVPDTTPETVVPATPPENAAPSPAPVAPHETRPYREPAIPADAAKQPEPVKAAPAPVTAPPKKAAVTVQDTSAPLEPDEDFRAAPNSAMQLHELMQPQ